MNENEDKKSAWILAINLKDALHEILHCDPDSIFTLNLVVCLFIQYHTDIHAHS